MDYIYLWFIIVFLIIWFYIYHILFSLLIFQTFLCFPFIFLLFRFSWQFSSFAWHFYSSVVIWTHIFLSMLKIAFYSSLSVHTIPVSKLSLLHILFNFCNSPVNINIPIYWWENEVKSFAWEHKANNWQGQSLNPLFCGFFYPLNSVISLV